MTVRSRCPVIPGREANPEPITMKLPDKVRRGTVAFYPREVSVYGFRALASLAPE
jgi:hypothetical protein